ncbi:ABC transporter substrate-binding protein [Paenibacillus allorhizosphaerae]|uniref:Aliphatic sulfonates-binding protein n=1 Tax=Paenibacillus allorhizosphaerae TaxID=2849866 RepID=A0ABN7TLV1_9BACL|nr:ABC transporter substrate-binding protein [Paenibacillus allorhizosphaerae]CAG7646174.1 Putative aliphatic sulfonates-binding protein [Paenibacillus allorhizosphaerae]
MLGWRGTKRIWVTGLLVMALALTGCGGKATPASGGKDGKGEAQNQQELVKWKHGIVKARGDASYQLMAKEKNFFKKHGVNIEYMEFESDVTMLQALVADQIDSMEANPASALTAVQQGAKLKVIGSTLSVNPFVLYVKSNIKSFDDLKGKTVGTSAPGSMPEMSAKAMLKAKGIDVNSVTIVNAGADAQRYQALVAGKLDATAANSDYVVNAASDGIKVLAYASDVIPDYPRFVVIASEKSLKDRPQGAVGFLAAQSEGLTYALEHRSEAIALAAKTMNVPTDNEGIIQVYDEFKNKNFVSPNLEIPVKKIEWLQDLQIELGRMKGKVDVNSIVDGSFREQALKKVSGSK